MYAALLALTSCVGAWIAWRRHPLYSPTATFRVVGEILLLIGASICIIIVTVYLIQKQPVGVQVGVLFAVIVLLTLGMIFSISAVTVPKSAKLNTTVPKAVPILNLRRRSVVHWLKVTAVYVAICAAVCAIPGPPRYIAASLLGLGALLACVMLPTAYIMARRFDRSATALTLHPWLHWHYSAQEWQAWSAARVERLAAQPATFTLKRDWPRILWLSVCLLGGMLLFSPGGWGFRIGWAAFCIAMIIGFVELAAWDARRAPDKLRAQLQHAAPDTYFGDDGLLCDGRLMTWLGADVYLTAVGMDERAPRSLLMQFEKVMPNPYGAPQTLKISQNILIPAGGDGGDLSVLRKALESRCPKATMAL
jgi:hypothetical protein